MCGIFAVYSPDGLPQHPETYLRPLRTLAHRGPDDEGHFLNNQVFLGHRRLSILDLSPAGHQPMMSDDRRLALIFNGQIYNWRDIRTELEARGRAFASACDTEVILKAYQEWGTACFARLHGMWAIILWDAATNSLVVSRDRMGQKPLYLYRQGRTWVLSSEIKAILAFAPQAAEVNPLAVYRFVARAWQDFDATTFYKDIVALQPASVTVVRGGEARTDTYWRLHVRPDERMAPGRFRAVFEDAVRRHLQSDVPVAIALSGGIDSGSIAALATRAIDFKQPIHAFSICPPDAPDESPLIEATVRHTGIAHSYVDTGAIDYPSAIAEMIDRHDEPPPKVNHLYQYLLRKEVGRAGYKVILAGEGADEILGGYAKYAPMYLASLLAESRRAEARAFMHGALDLTGLPPRTLLARAHAYRHTGKGARAVQEHLFGHDLLASGLAFDLDLAFPPSSFPELGEGSERRFMHREMLDRLRLDIPMVLRMEDRNGMAHGVEVRSPFIDHMVIEAAYSFPQHMTMKGGLNKWPLRQAVADVVAPEVLATKSKMRRPGSDRHVVYDHLAGPLADLLSSGMGAGLLHPQALDMLHQENRRRDDNNAFVWFRVFCLLTWLDQLKDRRGRGR